MAHAEYRTCQFCRKQDVVYDDGMRRLFKYGVRHYAHAECLLRKRGEAAFEMIPEHELRAFPALVASKFGMLPLLCSKLGIEW